jgi:hypothetical protein
MKTEISVENVIDRMSNEKSLKALEKKLYEMSNPNIVEQLKKRFDREGYKSGFCDGFRLAIEYLKHGV